jgi:hypothetical protein
LFDSVIGPNRSGKLCCLTLGKGLIMWEDDPDMMDAFEEYDEEYEYEGESDEDLSELGFDSLIAADADDDAFDKDADFYDDED